MGIVKSVIEAVKSETEIVVAVNSVVVGFTTAIETLVQNSGVAVEGLSELLAEIRDSSHEIAHAVSVGTPAEGLVTDPATATEQPAA